MASTTPPEPKSEQEVLSTYRQMQQEMQGLIQNLTKIEMERNEHRCVGFCCCVGKRRIAVLKLGRQGTGGNWLVGNGASFGGYFGSRRDGGELLSLRFVRPN